MADLAPFSATTKPKVYLERDWNSACDHAFEKAATFIVRKNSSYYEVIKGGTTSGAGTIAFGGEENAGSASGTDFDAVIQAAINSITANATCTFFFKPADYEDWDTTISTGTRNVYFFGSGGWNTDVSGTGTTLKYEGTGAAISVGAYRDFSIHNFRLEGGDPFLDFANSGGVGNNHSIYGNSFYDCDIGIQTGVSNPYMQIKNNRFHCKEIGIDVESQSDSIIQNNMFFSTGTENSGTSVAHVVVRADAGVSWIINNGFMSTYSTAPDILLEVGGTGSTDVPGLTISGNKFGTEEIAAVPPSCRISISDLGIGYAVLRTVNISNNKVFNTGTSGSIPDFIEIDGGGDVEVTNVIVNDNHVGSAPGTGYLFDAGTSVNSRWNSCTGNTWDAGVPGTWASMPFLGLIDGAQSGHYPSTQGFVCENNPGWPSRSCLYTQVSDGDTVNHYLPITAAQIAAGQVFVTNSLLVPESTDLVQIGVNNFTTTTFTVNVREGHPDAPVSAPTKVSAYFEVHVIN